MYASAKAIAGGVGHAMLYADDASLFCGVTTSRLVVAVIVESPWEAFWDDGVKKRTADTEHVTCPKLKLRRRRWIEMRAQRAKGILNKTTTKIGMTSLSAVSSVRSKLRIEIFSLGAASESNKEL